MMTTAKKQYFYFSVQINQQDYLRYYQGTARSVRVMSECGKNLRFPASRLRPFLTHTGISGRFRLTTDTDNRFVEMCKTN